MMNITYGWARTTQRLLRDAKQVAKVPRDSFGSVRELSRLVLVLVGCTALLGLVAVPAGAAGDDPGQPRAEVRVEPAVIEQLAEQGTADFWVVLGQRADLSKASEITDWAQRGQYVYDQLTSTAQATQSQLTARLDALGVRYESFWIANALLVRGGSQAALDTIRSLPGVAEIGARRTFALPDPVTSGSAHDDARVSVPTFDVNPSGRAVPYITLDAVGAPPTEGTTPELVWVGRGCVDSGGDEHLADPAGKVALIIRGVCTFEEKYAGAVAAGAVGVLIYNNIPGPFFGSGVTDRGVFGVGISDTDGAHLRQLLDDGEMVTLIWTDNQAPEWGIANIRADQVWNDLGVRGEGIVVGNIDTGVSFQHSALNSQYRGNLGAGSYDHNHNWWDPSIVCGNPSTAPPCDNNGHGTHTMGTMVGDDGGTNQIGVAPGAKWIAAKGCESNQCSDFAILSSGQFMLAPTDLNGEDPRPDLRPHVVNNSWGEPNGPVVSPWFRDIVTAWTAAGIFGVFSNGNNGPGCDTTGSPADYVEAWGVGAYDMSGAIASFSSRGPGENGRIRPNIAAPGVNVRSSIPTGGYAFLSGTSMAAPHQAGAVALLLSAAPDLVGDIGATRQIFNQTAIDVNDTTCGGTPENNNVYGEGRLDAYAAVESALGGEPPSEASQDVVATVPEEPGEGSLVISVDPADRVVTLPPVALAPSGDRLATSGELRPVTVTDTRTDTNPGWDASAQVGEFDAGSSSFGGGFLGWSPEVIFESEGQEVTAGSPVVPGFPSGDGLSVPQTLASAGTGVGVGTAELGAGLDLEIPVDTSPGTYTAVLTLTAI